MTHTNHVIKSEKLGKDINVRVYGTKGYPVIAFPTQDQMADEWEANGMTEVFAPYIEDGRVQLFTVDSNDLESWSNPSDDFAARIGRQEDYYDFVCDELLPFVHETNGSQLRPELTGASLGATQATICALRRPDLFQGVIALSGMYHTSYFFGDWGNETSYANDVNAFLPNTPLDHPYIELYRQRTFAFAIGQAPDEQFGVSDLHFLQQTFDRLGISGWFDFWGPESNHDWYWWKQQMAKFLPEAVKELEGVAASEPELTKPLPKKAEAGVSTKVAAEAKKAVRGRVASARKTAQNAAKKAEEKADAAAKKAEDDVAKAKNEAESAIAKTTKKVEKKVADTKAEAERVTEDAKAKAEAKRDEIASKATEAKTSAKATASTARKNAQAKAASVTKKATEAKEAGAKKATAAKAKAESTTSSAKAKATATKAKAPARKASTTARKSTTTARKTTKKSAK